MAAITRGFLLASAVHHSPRHLTQARIGKIEPAGRPAGVEEPSVFNLVMASIGGEVSLSCEPIIYYENS